MLEEYDFSHGVRGKYAKQRAAERSNMKDQFLRRLVAGAPKVLETFDPATGRFMTPGYSGPDLGWAWT